MLKGSNEGVIIYLQSLGNVIAIISYGHVAFACQCQSAVNDHLSRCISMHVMCQDKPYNSRLASFPCADR